MSSTEAATTPVVESQPKVKIEDVRKAEIQSVGNVLLRRKIEEVSEEVRSKGTDGGREVLRTNDGKNALFFISYLSEPRSYITEDHPDGMVLGAQVPLTLDGRSFNVSGIREGGNGKLVCNGVREDGTEAQGIVVDLNVYAAAALTLQEADIKASGVLNPGEAVIFDNYLAVEHGKDPYEGKNDDEVSQKRVEVVMAAREQGMLTREDADALIGMALEARRNTGDSTGVAALEKELRDIQGDSELASTALVRKVFAELNPRRSEMNQVERYLGDLSSGVLPAEEGIALSTAIQSGDLIQITEALSVFRNGVEGELSPTSLDVFLKQQEESVDPNRKNEKKEPIRNTPKQNELLVALRCAGVANNEQGVLVKIVALEQLQASGTMTDIEEDFVQEQLTVLQREVQDKGLGKNLVDSIVINMPGASDQMIESIRTMMDTQGLSPVLRSADNNPLLAQALVSTLFSNTLKPDDLLNIADIRSDKEKADGVPKIPFYQLLLLIIGAGALGTLAVTDKALQKGLQVAH